MTEINDIQFGAMLEEALAVVAKTHNCTYKVIGKKGKGGPPFAVFLNRPGSKSCYMHNVSRGIVAVCGNSLDKILLACCKYWLEDGIDRINICSAVLDARYTNQLKLSGETYDAKSFRNIVERAKMLAHSNVPSEVLAMDQALPFMREDVFADERSRKAIFDSIDTFGDVPAMVRQLNYLGYAFTKEALALVDDQGQRIGRPAYSRIGKIVNKAGKKGQPSQEAVQTAELLGISPRAVEMLCLLVATVGTPGFIKQYHQYLEDERVKRDTLASGEDIATLLGTLHCSLS
jgi:hypothetical protein